MSQAPSNDFRSDIGENEKPMNVSKFAERKMQDVEAQDRNNGISSTMLEKLKANATVERRGIVPVPIEERTNRRIYGIFTLWVTVSTNLLP